MLWDAQRCAVHAKAHIRTNISSALSTSSASQPVVPSYHPTSSTTTTTTEDAFHSLPYRLPGSPLPD
jgi:hypothetical protein